MKFRRIGIFLSILLSFSCSSLKGVSVAESYNNWFYVGQKASYYAQSLLGKAYGYVVLTNAGYSEVNGQETKGSIDGITSASAVSIGNNTVVQVHSSPWSNLWFAFYDPFSGNCVYMEVDSKALEGRRDFHDLKPSQIFKKTVLEKINYQYVIEKADEFDKKIQNKIFGGNEFRIITIANALALKVPNYFINAITFHDHYCPGVTSGILMVNWVKKNFPLDGRNYFVQTIDPWCKEDALIMILNATPGKKQYSVTYPSSEDKAKWKEDYKNATTIIYRQDPSTNQWEGIILGFTFASQTGCENIKSSTIQRICADIYYLRFLETPEEFVKPLYKFILPPGKTPQDLSRPGVSVMKELGLTID